MGYKERSDGPEKIERWVMGPEKIERCVMGPEKYEKPQLDDGGGGGVWSLSVNFGKLIIINSP